MGRIRFINRNVKACLLEFFFDIELAAGLKLTQNRSHPGYFLQRHSLFSKVDRLAGEMWRGGVAGCWRGVAVIARQVSLEAYSANG